LLASELRFYLIVEQSFDHKTLPHLEHAHPCTCNTNFKYWDVERLISYMYTTLPIAIGDVLVARCYRLVTGIEYHRLMLEMWESAQTNYGNTRMDWFIYPSMNYSKMEIESDSLHSRTEMDNMRGIWLSSGMLRSVHLLLVSHQAGLPHVLLLRSATNGTSTWRLPSGFVDAGTSDTVIFCHFWDNL